MTSLIARNLKPWAILRRAQYLPSSYSVLAQRCMTTEGSIATPSPPPPPPSPSLLHTSSSPKERNNERKDRTPSVDEMENRTLLVDIPKSMIHSDVKRLMGTIGIDGINEIQLSYIQFVRAGGAFLHFVSKGQRDVAREQLNTFSRARPYLLRRPRTVHNPNYHIETSVDETGKTVKTIVSTRRRGPKGVNEALLKGTTNGTGGDANIHDRAMNVVISGLPRIYTADRLSSELRRRFTLREDIDCVLKLPSTRANSSSFLVRCESPAEAHRIMRTLHHGTLRSEVPDLPKLTARLVY